VNNPETTEKLYKEKHYGKPEQGEMARPMDTSQYLAPADAGLIGRKERR
jgi:hypothetical protein